MVDVKQILSWIDAYAPFRYCADWDNCGLQVGDPNARVDSVLVALDITSGTIDEALERGCGAIVTHHPLLFRPQKTVRTDVFPGKLIAAAIRNDIHLIAAHTNLDAARNGVNSHLAACMELQDLKPLETDSRWLDEPDYGGMGRIGQLAPPCALEALAARLASVLNGNDVRFVGQGERKVRRVALCSGSGGSLLDIAIEARCDAYVTGDIKYHEAQSALEAGIGLIDVGHFASEFIIVEPLASYLRNRARREGVDLEVRTSTREVNPFQTIVP